MPTPLYILELRKHIGNDLLLLPGVTAVVVRDTDSGPEVLLGRRTDNGLWSLPAGIVEPGEQPAVALVREILEETQVVARADRLIEIRMGRPVTFGNGDRCQFLLHYFRCSYVSGVAAVGDEESTAVGWFSPDNLPDDFNHDDHDRILRGLPLHGDCTFQTEPPVEIDDGALLAQS